MESREISSLTLIYARRKAERQVLLGLKKRGFGAGKVNGFGGKLEPGESLEESAARELQEESGLKARSSDFRWCGTLHYVYETKPKAMEVYVFDLDTWEGEPTESEEMKPSWFAHEAIPLKEMWADDEHWLLQYLDGELATPFWGRFRFKGHEGADSFKILEKEVCPMSLPVSLKEHRHEGAALVVATVSFKSAPSGRPLESFLRYHFLKGFAHVLVFVDDAQDGASLAALRKFPAARVSARVRGDALRQEQEAACSLFPSLKDLTESDVSARQMLDAELAMTLAPSLGCSWVTCLDSDELFFSRESSVVPHFAQLAADGVDQMSYVNHEAVPEVPETVDYFATSTLFRKHHFEVPLSSEARQGLNFWMERRRRRQYLLFYDNGKSACRSGLGAVPRSQHLWQLPCGRKSCSALADMRRMDVEGYRRCEDPCILHFPCCGLGWLKSKYRQLGAFSDKWLEKVKLPESFHTDAREAAAAGDEALEELFRREVLLDDDAEAARQVASGTCVRITEHTALLESIPRAPKPVTAAKPVAAATGSLPDAPQGVERGWILSKSMGYL